ncbi:MAG: hypothetical protein LDL31_01410 [Prosthecobacter sp.]|nr:hypothetical protein [Prosthecobacter sp.]
MLSAADGTTFLSTRWYESEYLMVRPVEKRVVRPVLKSLKIDGSTAMLSVALPEKGWCRWQLNGQEKTKASSAAEIRLESLAIGEHRLKVWTYDRCLLPCREPLEVEITIKPDSEAVLRKLLEALDGSLAEREAAASRLRLQGRSILPLLREERAKADESRGWWLDAVIQHLESTP